MSSMHEQCRQWAENGPAVVPTTSALTFAGKVAFSYAEPIAVMDRPKVYMSRAKFSVTTSKHQSVLGGQCAIAGLEVVYIDHEELRKMAGARSPRSYVTR
jgi:hypothetical protein